jgi:hypothetical protein
MLPLLGIVAELFPDIVKQLGAPLHEQSGSLQDQVLTWALRGQGIKFTVSLLAPVGGVGLPG